MKRSLPALHIYVFAEIELKKKKKKVCSLKIVTLPVTLSIKMGEKMTAL